MMISRRLTLLAVLIAGRPAFAQQLDARPAPAASPSGVDSSALPQAAWAAGARPDTAPGPAAQDTVAESPPPAHIARSSRRWTPDPFNVSVIGLRLSFFHYHELFPEHEILDDYNVDRIEGQPKSAEYGLCEGVHIETVRRVRQSDVFVRPKLDAVMGLLHRYDGSTHAEVTVDSSGRVATFNPAEGVKNNYFLNAAFDVGAGPLRRTRGLAAWGGISGRLWRRRLWGDDEYYYWFSLPLGLLGYAAIGDRWTLGLELSVDFMLAGWMKLVLGAESGEEPPDVPAVRLSDGVPFGRRASLSISAPVTLRPGPGAGVRFVPWFEYYHFERSNNECLDAGSCTAPGDTWFYEPASRTFVAGLGTEVVIYRGRRP